MTEAEKLQHRKKGLTGLCIMAIIYFSQGTIYKLTWSVCTTLYHPANWDTCRDIVNSEPFSKPGGIEALLIVFVAILTLILPKELFDGKGLSKFLAPLLNRAHSAFIMLGILSAGALGIVIVGTVLLQEPFDNVGMRFTGMAFGLFLLVSVLANGITNGVRVLITVLIRAAALTLVIHVIFAAGFTYMGGESFGSAFENTNRLYYASLVGLFTFIFNSLEMWQRPFEPDEPQRIAVRGSGLISIQDGLARLQKLMNPALPGVFFGPSRVPYELETQHFLLVGSTGAGKTNDIKQLLMSIAERVGSAKYPQNRAVVLDPKREFLSILHYGVNLGAAREKRREPAPIVIMDLFDRRSTWWNIAGDVRDAADCLSLANILIPERGKDERGDPFWTDAARMMTADVINGLRRTCGTNWRLRDLLIILQKKGLMDYFISQVPLPESQEMLDMDKTTQGFRATFLTYVRPFNQAAAAMHWLERHGDPDGQSLNAFVENEAIFLIINDPKRESVTQPINNAILGRLSELLRSQPEARTLAKRNADRLTVEPRSFFVVDEAKSVGRIPGLTNMLTDGRSRGISCVVSFPSPFGMKDVYGENNLNDIVSLCNSLGAYRLDKTAAREVAGWFGDYLAKDTTSSVSMNAQGHRSESTSSHFARDNVVEATELEQLAHIQSGRVESYWKYREIPPFKAVISADHYAQNVWSKEQKSGEDLLVEIPRGEDHLELLPFDESDFRRLNIPPELWGTQHAQSVKEPSGANVCPACQEDNRPNARFCGHCGGKLGEAVPRAPERTRTSIFDDV